MQLSARLMIWHLNKTHTLISSSSLSPEPNLNYAVHYQPDAPLENGRIYLANASGFLLPARRPSHTLFLLAGPSGDKQLLNQPNLCIAEDMSVTELWNAVNEIYQIYNAWNQTLFESRLNNASVQNLLNLTQFIIPNPIMVISMDFVIIASRNLATDGLLNATLGSNAETVKVVSALKQDENYAKASHRIGYFYYPGNDVTVPSLCVNIRKFDQTVYRLMITEGEVPLDDTFGFILEYLARVIANSLSTNLVDSHDARHHLHQVFRTLLTDPSADYVKVSQQLTLHGWLSSHTYLCILIETGELDYKNLTLRSICSYVENSIPACAAVEHRSNVVVFVNFTLCQLSISELEQKLAGFIRDSFLRAGYSRRLLGHFNFHRQYVQACIAIETGSRKNPHQWIHHFNDIALPYLLEQTTKKLPAYMICHEKLLSLKYQSEENGTALYQTLRCFLENHQNISQTARDLFIHRSTLLYRLDRIHELLGSDYSDPDEHLYLLLSFRLIDLDEQT